MTGPGLAGRRRVEAGVWNGPGGPLSGCTRPGLRGGRRAPVRCGAVRWTHTCSYVPRWVVSQGEAALAACRTGCDPARIPLLCLSVGHETDFMPREMVATPGFSPAR